MMVGENASDLADILFYFSPFTTGVVQGHP